MSAKATYLVIKLGGELLKPGALGKRFFDDLQWLSMTHNIVVVHGGGPQMNAEAKRIGHVPEIVQGRRVTKDKDLEILNRILGDKLNGELVQEFKAKGLKATGLKGSDDIVMVEKRPPRQIGEKIVDFGWVGDVSHVNIKRLAAVASDGGVSLVATMGCDTSGQIFNVNGDTVAAEIAKALESTSLFFLTGVGQVQNASRVPMNSCNQMEFEKGIEEGWIQGGMRVKIETGLMVLKSGQVEEVLISDAESIRSREKCTALI